VKERRKGLGGEKRPQSLPVVLFDISSVIVVVVFVV